MVVSIMQPAYLPWLGYLDRIRRSDVHIVLDHVQMDENSKTKFVNRNKIRTGQGWCWLTIPLKTKGIARETGIDKLEVSNDTPWAANHWATMKFNYSKTPHFAAHAPFFESEYQKPHGRLVEIIHNLSTYLLDAFEIRTARRLSSEMGVPGKKDELILNLCQAVGATAYLSGPFGRDYLKPESFRRAGIELLFHDYTHPVYPQAYPGFEPFMSAVDLLFNCGRAGREILTGGAEL